MIQFEEHIFETGWFNHQLDYSLDLQWVALLCCWCSLVVSFFLDIRCSDGRNPGNQLTMLPYVTSVFHFSCKGFFLHPGGEGFRSSVVFGLHGRKWCGCEWGCVEIMWEAYPISWCHSTSVYFSIMVLGVPTITPNIIRISTQLIDWSGEKSP